MATAKKAPAKKGLAKKAPAKKPAAKKAAPAKPAAPKPAAKKAAKAPPEPKPKAAAAKAPRAAPKPPVERTRLVIAMDVYEPQKDVIKQPFKEHGLKWNFLGEGKGLYKRPDGGVHCFTQFLDDGVHYSLWGDDKATVQKVLDHWKGVLGAEGYAKATAGGQQAVAAEKAQAESDAMRLWRLAEPQPRPGEPEFFLKKRVAEWQAKKPSA